MNEINEIADNLNKVVDIANSLYDNPKLDEEQEKYLLTFIFTLFFILIYISIYIYKKQEAPILKGIINIFK